MLKCLKCNNKIRIISLIVPQLSLGRRLECNNCRKIVCIDFFTDLKYKLIASFVALLIMIITIYIIFSIIKKEIIIFIVASCVLTWLIQSVIYASLAVHYFNTHSNIKNEKSEK